MTEFEKAVMEKLDHLIEMLQAGGAAPNLQSEWFNEDGVPVGKRVKKENGEWGWVHKGDWDTARKACSDCEAPILFILSKMGPTPKPGQTREPGYDGPKWVTMNPEGSCHYDTCKVKVRQNMQDNPPSTPPANTGFQDEVPF